ncbi:CDP-glycerol glycerophosphotransferase family protein [Nocardioides sp. Kera G14]|uniref:CDP-glycerol glycerophosphotransferase family protein n=1 Tax=Nocardioides sp. Kera G14 TaxID=2884264 RepID=UPI001D129AF0|nr:CDP-glycerol glycerophosphotransferase family protein [Nocardioides sp. Kera G14]UDY23192.1 CDP-glycerol glycerophosphotransferase family protein [Nocardioides sp. Kera G14]
MSTLERPVRVAFILTRVQLWGAFETLVQAARAHVDVEAEVVLVDSPSYFQSHERATIARLLGTVRLRDEGWLREQIGMLDVLVFHDPYLGDWMEPGGLGHELVSAGSRVVLSPYALALHGSPEIRRMLFDLPFHHAAWRIYAPSAGQAEMFRSLADDEPDEARQRIRFLGYAKQERLLSSRTAQQEAKRLRRRVGRRTITLWNPHFPDADGTFTFATFAPLLLERAVRWPQEGLIVRPHPRLMPELESTPKGAASAARFRELCRTLGNVVLDESPDPAPAMLAADALISDVSSLVAEYAVLNRPTLLTVPPGGILINDPEGFTADLPRATGPTELTAFLDSVRPAATALPEASEVHGTGERIIDDLVEAVRAEQHQESTALAR